jgi:hypothetical protein
MMRFSASFALRKAALQKGIKNMREFLNKRTSAAFDVASDPEENRLGQRMIELLKMHALVRATETANRRGGFMGAFAKVFLRLAAAIAGIFFCQTSAAASDDDILFAKKNYIDLGAALNISGTLTGNGIGYRNNTVAISCFQDRQECFVPSIEQIGSGQIGGWKIRGLFLLKNGAITRLSLLRMIQALIVQRSR